MKCSRQSEQVISSSRSSFTAVVVIDPSSSCDISSTKMAAMFFRYAPVMNSILACTSRHVTSRGILRHQKRRRARRIGTHVILVNIN